MRVPTGEPADRLVRWNRATIAEAAAVALMGGLAGWLTGLPLGLETVTGPIAAANGAVAGLTGIYAWRRRSGMAAFLLDSSWSLIGTATALAVHAAQILWPDPRYRADLSHRYNAHVYEGGFALKKGYAFTAGNLISNAGGSVGLDGEGRPARRRAFIDRHEYLHVWQNRAFGPLFQVLYLGWMVLGAFGGTMAWLRIRRDIGRLIETAAYFNNPFEYWAYVRDGHWPPRDAHPELVWTRTAGAPRSKPR